ncbi:MAG TPA: RagB/SusD family nutrient uptake outer membrane protein, partial [Chitinophagaceae bacterium]|nr:RagB/SusD family nutrient uptake outer membrane protein [Chitinophagaceae bacterium]
MKNRFLAVTITLVSGSVLLNSCKDSFLEQRPQGVYDVGQLSNAKGVNGLLISAYAALDGNDNTWYAGASNWVWGSVAGGDAYKGSEQSDQVDVNPIMIYQFSANNPIILNKWNGIWDGVGQANQVLKVLPNVTDMSDADKTRIQAEARFLRGFHHFEGKKMFNNIPYVDETTTNFRVPNTDASGAYVNVWPQIEADLQFAYDNLPATMPNKGRVNKWAAGAFLAKAYMFQNKFTEAKALFDAIIGPNPAEAIGTNAQGQKYKLAANIHENFRVTSEMNPEVIFSIQASYGDGATRNGNYDNALNYPHSSTTPGAGCCGFFQPTQNLVNSYKTNAQGLPEPATYNNTDVTNDANLVSSDPFTPYQGNLDPRLDHTVGRRGIPYLDWGVHPGRNWIRKIDFGGPYSPKKHVFYKSDIGATAGSAGWGWNNNALNYPAMRYADLLLMAAEAEIEVGSMEKAREYINLVRARAANSEIAGADANYVIGQYTAPFGSKDEARTAVRFERKLELAMEGHRFFDLVRWGIAAQELNTNYLQKEIPRLPNPLTGANFTANRNEYYPIPEFAIIQS